MAGGRRGNYAGGTKNYGRVDGHNGLVDTIIGTHGYVSRGAHRGAAGGGALLRHGQVTEDARDRCPAA